MDLSLFASPEAWISLVTLTFLEIVLGVDNIVFIAVTTNRLPKEKQHIGRKLGLAGAFVSRCIFLTFAYELASMTNPLFTVDFGFWSRGISMRDLIMLVGGSYLIYKGIQELRDMLALTEIKAEHSEEHKSLHQISLGQAVGTIMAMDVVFSIDSVITAVGLANHLIIMILAVLIAILLMMTFIDTVSDFINSHPEMKILALVFITVIGGLLVLDGLGINSGIEVLDMHMEKLMVYFAMLFSVALEAIQVVYNGRVKNYYHERINAEQDEDAEDEAVIATGQMQADATGRGRETESAADGTAVKTSPAADDTAGKAGPTAGDASERPTGPEARAASSQERDAGRESDVVPEAGRKA